MDREAPCQKTRVEIADLRTDRGNQTRSSINVATVKEYAECMIRGRKFPPFKVCQVNGELWVVDGFHRLEAARQCGFTDIEVEVFDGTRSDAPRASLGANHTEGLPRSNANKRFAAELAVKEFRRYSDRRITKICGASCELVGDVKDQLSNLTVLAFHAFDWG